MILTVYNKKMAPLFTGTKQDCMNYMRLNKLNRQLHSIAEPQERKPTIVLETTSYEQPKGFFKRIFK